MSHLRAATGWEILSGQWHAHCRGRVAGCVVAEHIPGSASQWYSKQTSRQTHHCCHYHHHHHRRHYPLHPPHFAEHKTAVWRRFKSCWMWCCVEKVAPNGSKDHSALTFRVTLRTWPLNLKSSYCSTLKRLQYSPNDTASHFRRPEPSAKLNSSFKVCVTVYLNSATASLMLETMLSVFLTYNME